MVFIMNRAGLFPGKKETLLACILQGYEVPVGDLTYTCKDISFAFEICEDAWRESRPAQLHSKRGVS